MGHVDFIQIAILTGFIGLIAVVILFLFKIRTRLGLAPLFAILGVFQFMQAFLAGAVFVELAPGIVVSPGSTVMFTGTLFAILLIYIKEDASTARKLIYSLVAANVLITVFLYVFGLHFHRSTVINPFNFSEELFSSNAWLLLVGTFLFYVDCIFLILLFEFSSRFITSLYIRIALTASIILSIDTVLFSLAGFFRTDNLEMIICSGILSKSAASIIYASLFTPFLVYFDKKQITESEHTSADIFSFLTYRQRYEKAREEILRVEKASEEALGKSESRRRDAIRQTRELGQRNKIILDTMMDGFLLVNSSGTIIDLNDSFCDISGYQKNDLIGSNLRDLKVEMTEEEINHRTKLFEAKGSARFETVLNDKHGKPTELDVRFTSMESGNEKLVAVFCTDITERKMVQKELEKHQRELENLVKERTTEVNKAYKELESFSYSVSHDLRAPLTRINGFGKALEKTFGDLLGNKGKHYIRRIRASSEDMGALIDSLLMLSKVTTKGFKKETINLGALAQDIFDGMKLDHPGRKMVLSTENDMMIRMDSALARIMMENLLNNAWKFTIDQKVGQIEIGRTEMDNANWFYIRDNGIGFDMKEYDRLFEPFSRLRGTEKIRGTGVGLATVKRIIDRHNGEIIGESKMGMGATFYFKV